MEIEDFDLIQEMAAAQKALDETFYKNGSKRPTQLANNLSLMRVFGKWIDQTSSIEEDEHAFMEGPKFMIVDCFALDLFLDLWTIVLRSAERRKAEDIRVWMLGKYLGMDWMNLPFTDTFFEYALYIIQSDPRTKLRALVQLSEAFGFSIELIHEAFMKLKELQLSEINKEKKE